LIDATDLIVATLRPAIEHAETTNAAILELRRIISRKRFDIYLQPISRLDDGLVIGVEALTRFEDGTRPDIRFAEAARLGMGAALERATLSTAMETVSALPKEVALSVNISPDVLQHDRSIREIIAGAERPVIVELTEHERIDDYDAVRAAFATLGPNTRLAVDDAGSGYASLRHILALDPSFVKLDMAWVRGSIGIPCAGRSCRVSRISRARPAASSSPRGSSPRRSVARCSSSGYVSARASCSDGRRRSNRPRRLGPPGRARRSARARNERAHACRIHTDARPGPRPKDEGSRQPMTARSATGRPSAIRSKAKTERSSVA